MAPELRLLNPLRHARLKDGQGKDFFSSFHSRSIFRPLALCSFLSWATFYSSCIMSGMLRVPANPIPPRLYFLADLLWVFSIQQVKLFMLSSVIRLLLSSEIIRLCLCFVLRQIRN
jgi:hypothetical protein